MPLLIAILVALIVMALIFGLCVFFSWLADEHGSVFIFVVFLLMLLMVYPEVVGRLS